MSSSTAAAIEAAIASSTSTLAERKIVGHSYLCIIGKTELRTASPPIFASKSIDVAARALTARETEEVLLARYVETLEALNEASDLATKINNTTHDVVLLRAVHLKLGQPTGLVIRPEPEENTIRVFTKRYDELPTKAQRIEAARQTIEDLVAIEQEETVPQKKVGLH